MGYAVYPDPAAEDRWAGYAVPAACDVPDCTQEIDRGYAYRCEPGYTFRYYRDGVEVDENADWDQEVEIEPEGEGCGRFFCPRHQAHAEHGDGVPAKPDSATWQLHQLTDPTWEPWRLEHPGLVAELTQTHAEQLRRELVDARAALAAVGSALVADSSREEISRILDGPPQHPSPVPRPLSEQEARG